MADEPLNFQIPPKGYDSYLEGILPDDQAVLAGAFAMSMMQIKNIQNIKLKDFAEVAFNNETTFGLPAVNGTDIPTDLQLAQVAQTLTALGSGIYGTYTMSNFFGCMSGLPYPLRDIYNGIKELETNTLRTIYQNLYLAVTWDPAVATVNVGGSPGAYTVSLATAMPVGGGYGREGGGLPAVTVDGATGITATATIGTDPDNLTTYGKITDITFSGTSTTLPSGTLTIDNPPTTHGSAGWSPGMNDAIQYYIDEANDEIEAIENASPANFRKAQILDTNWNITGIALKHEQRARYIAIPPVPVPYDRWLTNYPVSLYTFVDSIPQLAQDTLPHMSAQTLEHISDLDLLGGQSLVAMMRQERNQVRMADIGVGLDNNLPDSLPPEVESELMTDGVYAGAVEGINGYTIPAWPEDTEPLTVYDPDIPGLRYINELDDGTIEPLLDIQITDIPIEGDPPVIIDGIPRPPRAPTVIVNPRVPIALGDPVQPEDYPLQPTIAATDPTLDANNTGTTLYPSTYNIPEAIEKVVECNCDCWVY